MNPPATLETSSAASSDRRTPSALVPAVVAIAALMTPLHAAEVLELGPDTFAERPGGKEADSIVGDFLLRNDRVEAVVSGNLPLRRANMSTFYGEGGITPGCLYDLSLKGQDNDQLVAFCPNYQRGAINYVRIVDEGGDQDAVLEVFVSAARNRGLSVRHEYRLADGDAGITITSTLTNETSAPLKRDKLSDTVVKFRSSGSVDKIAWYDSIDPDDKCGYAVGTPAEAEGPRSGIELAPGESLTVTRFVAVGTSPAAAVSEVARKYRDTGALSVVLRDENNQPLSRGRVLLKKGNARFPAYPDEKGRLDLTLPTGSYELSIEEIGRPSQPQSLELQAGAEEQVEARLEAASAISFAVTDQTGTTIPCKAQFNPVEGTAKPNLGPTDRAHGCVDQYHSEKGEFRVQLPPGSYDVIVTRGPEFSHHRERVDLKPGQDHRIETSLERLVKTPGWVSTDFHNHSTPSGDNTCGVDDRIINIAAEQIEFAPTTEHNRLYDWEPHIERLGLYDHLKTVPGMELTGRGAHFNAFPFRPDPTLQDGGAPVWQQDPRLNAIVLRDYQGQNPDRWVHLNHPDMSADFIDRNGDGYADGGFAYFGQLIDALESQNYRASRILAGAPYAVSQPLAKGGRIDYIREFIWLQLLNQGLPCWGVAVADAHHVHGNGVGGWRTYVRSSTDDPSKIDWREMSRNARAGRMILSTGPYLEVETESGVIAGGLDRINGTLRLKVRVQCTDWLDIDRVQVLVNGRQDPRYNYTRTKNPDLFGDGVIKFDQDLELKLSQDAHIIVVAVGENHDLSTGFGSSAQARIQPIAYNNPIFVDLDGGGFQPNGDTLGFDLPVKNLSVDEVKKALGTQ